MTIKTLLTAALLSALALTPVQAAAPDQHALASLSGVTITARDLKTLHYMENAHGQLEEWSRRLLSRLEQGMGPREKDPILDGRADLQVQKIAVTYAGYTKTPQLAVTLRQLADAHAKRLAALQRMVDAGADRTRYDSLDAPVQRVVAALNRWSQRHET